jgi:hypothetical protein
VAQAREDRDERRGEPGGDEDVERDLGDPEGGVIGVELGARSERVGEQPIADHARREVRERQDGQDDRAAGQDPVDRGARRRDDRGHGAAAVRRRDEVAGRRATPGVCTVERWS